LGIRLHLMTARSPGFTDHLRVILSVPVRQGKISIGSHASAAVPLYADDHEGGLTTIQPTAELTDPDRRECPVSVAESVCLAVDDSTNNRHARVIPSGADDLTTRVYGQLRLIAERTPASPGCRFPEAGDCGVTFLDHGMIIHYAGSGCTGSSSSRK